MLITFRDASGTADLVTFNEEIPNGKIHFLCSGSLKGKPLLLGTKIFG